MYANSWLKKHIYFRTDGLILSTQIIILNIFTLAEPQYVFMVIRILCNIRRSGKENTDGFFCGIVFFVYTPV